MRELRPSGSVGAATRRRTSSCYAFSPKDIPGCSAISPLPRHAARVTGRYEALGTMSPHAPGGAPLRRAGARLPARRRSGARGGGPGERQCTTEKRREHPQAQGAARLGPQGRWPGGDAPASSPAAGAPPAHRERLPPPVVLGRHVGSPSLAHQGKGAVRRADGEAGRGRGTKRRPSGPGGERSGARAPALHAHAG
jgi:hypothetical protein